MLDVIFIENARFGHRFAKWPVEILAEFKFNERNDVFNRNIRGFRNMRNSQVRTLY